MKIKMLLVVLLVLLVATSLSVGACSKPEPAPTPTTAPTTAPPVEPPWEWPDSLVIAAMSPASADYGAALAWAAPLGEDTGIKTRIMVEDNLVRQAIWVKQGVLFTSREMYGEMTEATGDTATRDGGPFQVRMWWPATRTGVGAAVRGDSDIQSLSDVGPGTRVIYIAFAAEPPLEQVKAMVSWSQADPESLVWVPADTIDQLGRLILEGKADICFSVFPTTPIWTEVAAGPHGLRFIEMNPADDPEGAARYHEHYPQRGFGPMTQGIDEAIGKWGFTISNAWSTRADEDPELIYNLVKWMDENKSEYIDAHPWAGSMTIGTMLELAQQHWMPTHDGTIKYLKEKGVWTSALEERNQEKIALLQRYIDAYDQAIATADENGIEVDPTNEVWVKLWEDYKTQLNLPRIETTRKVQ